MTPIIHRVGTYFINAVFRLGLYFRNTDKLWNQFFIEYVYFWDVGFGMASFVHRVGLYLRNSV